MQHTHHDGVGRRMVLQQALLGLAGKLCIYEEKWLVLAVRVRGLHLTSEGVLFELEPLDVAGLSDTQDLRRMPGAAWPVLRCREASVCGYGSWELHTSAHLVDRVLQLAQSAAGASADRVLDQARASLRPSQPA